MLSILKTLFYIVIITASFNKTFAADPEQSMWDVITLDDRFSTFVAMVKKAGVEHLFMGKIGINATVYLPTNDAFSTMPKSMASALRFPENKGPLTHLIKSHYFIGTTDNMKAGDYFMTTNINGDQIRIEQAKALFVKDMVIQSQSIRVGQSKIVPIECVMFVQPSKSDHRLSSSQQEQFPITSCCLRTVKEVKAFVQHTVLDAAEAFD